MSRISLIVIPLLLAGVTIAAMVVDKRPADEAPDVPANMQGETKESTEGLQNAADVTISNPEKTPELEQVRSNIRDVTPASVHRPPLPSGELIERLPALTTVYSQERKKKRVRWKRPMVEAAGILQSGSMRIELAGISPLPLDARCDSDDGATRPCGKIARMSLQRLVRMRTIECEAVEPEEAGESGLLRTRCQVSGHDLGGWLVRQGHARALAGSGYDEAETEARKARRGLWSAVPENAVR